MQLTLLVMDNEKVG